MAREKGRGNLQLEKSGRYTMRVSVGGRRLSRSTGTSDRVLAEQMLERFLAPLGLGALRLPLATAWQCYEMSPNRPYLAQNTLKSKRQAWLQFAKWIEEYHMEITDVAQVTSMVVEEYLAMYRCHHSASTFNGHVCILREVFRVLATRGGMSCDPWAGVRLLPDDCRSRRELTLDELERLFEAAAKSGPEWKLLVATGAYTGQRLGDCCRLTWESVNLERGIIQLIPSKTKKFAHGRPVTIPLHPELRAVLEEAPALARHGYVNPVIANFYATGSWKIDHALSRIFKAANIVMSVRVEGRRYKAVDASFHSLRHTFVSLATNAGVPIPVVQSIVGHSSTAMTMHYYHENEAALRAAVAAIPAVGKHCDLSTRNAGEKGVAEDSAGSVATIMERLARLDELSRKGLITENELKTHRARILAEV